MKKILFISILISFCLNFSFSQVKESLIHDGYLRTWLTHLPKNYQENKTYPLIIALHGGNGKAKKFNKSTKGRFNELSDEEGFIVVYPQGIDKSWNDNNKRNSYGKARSLNIDDVGFIAKMISKLENQYSIDSSNIFACGISNGGLMSATLATKLPNKIKAIGMVSSNFSKVHYEEMQTETPQPFSIIIIHGTQDPIFPYHEGETVIFNQHRGEVIGAENSIAYMINLNGNSSEGIETQLPNTALFDGCKATRIVYPNENNPNLKVELIKIIEGGHTWPGGYQYLPKKIIGNVTRDFNAADKLWTFFKSTIN